MYSDFGALNSVIGKFGGVLLLLALFISGGDFTFLCCRSSRLGDRERISLASWIESCSRREMSYTLEGEMCLQSWGGVGNLDFMFMFPDGRWYIVLMQVKRY